MHFKMILSKKSYTNQYAEELKKGIEPFPLDSREGKIVEKWFL